jgi:hypothetical protein
MIFDVSNQVLESDTTSVVALSGLKEATRRPTPTRKNGKRFAKWGNSIPSPARRRGTRDSKNPWKDIGSNQI